MLTLPLFPYQNEAVDHMVERGSLLVAFEMGLGKTILAIAAIEELLGSGEVSTTVIVVPASLKYQWAEQIVKATDVPTRQLAVKMDGGTQHLTVPIEKHCIIVADGGPKVRAALYAKIKATKPEYVIIGYENVLNDWNYVRRIKPECIVLDEGTAIKSFRAQRTKKIKRLNATYRFVLTGTPVENGKPEELFSIMQWVDKDVLGRWDLFDKSYVVRNNYGGVARYKNLPVLHSRLAEALERKTREDADVKPFMPEVAEKNIDVTMDAKTRKVYRHIANDLLAELQMTTPMDTFDLFAHYNGEATGGNTAQQGKIMARMGAIDMLLDHPDLIRRSAASWLESETQRRAGSQKKNWPGSKYCYELVRSGALEGLTSTPKLDRLLETVSDILGNNENNKIVLFSFYKPTLAIIAENLAADSYVIYDGDKSAAEKAYAKQRFTTDPKCRIFLSSHAGAYGTDLFMANYLINYDLAWSSGKQDQINRRHDRASSKFDNIYVLNMITRNSTEVRKLAVVKHKRRVGSAILDNYGSDDKGRVENDVETLTDCLTVTAN